MRLPHTTEEGLRKKGYKNIQDMVEELKAFDSICEEEISRAPTNLSNCRVGAGAASYYPGASYTPYYSPSDVIQIIDRYFVHCLKYKTLKHARQEAQEEKSNNIPSLDALVSASEQLDVKPRIIKEKSYFSRKDRIQIFEKAG